MFLKNSFVISLFLIVLAVLITACGGEEEDSSTPTVSYVSISDKLLRVELPDLIKDPQAFEGAYLQVEGQYRRLPLLFCVDDPYPAPFSWELFSDDSQIGAAGFDSQLRSLLANGSPVTVTGHWRRWQGTVGCGRRAVEQQTWYLQVDNIVSPDPLVRSDAGSKIADSGVFDLQPTPTVATTDLMGTATPEIEPTTSPLSDTPTPSPTSTPSPIVETTTGTPASLTPSPSSNGLETPTVTGQPTSSPTPETTTTSTATPTITVTVGATTPTPTGTRFAGEPTATATSPTATQPPAATATTAASTFTRVDQGTIEAEELVASFLNRERIHTWSFTIAAAETITVSAAAPASGDIILAIVDETGNTVAEQNQAAPGNIEIIAGLTLNQVGTYRVEVSSVSGAAAPYAMTLLFSDSYAFLARDILDYNTSLTRTMAEESDHFWFFEGDVNDTVTITVVPNDDGDLFLELYGTKGDRISDFVDEGIDGEQEQLLQFQLSGYGMYTIRVGEYEFNQTDYQITLTKN